MLKLLKKADLDYEWLKLMVEAKSIGLTVEEVQQFISESQETE